MIDQDQTVWPVDDGEVNFTCDKAKKKMFCSNRLKNSEKHFYLIWTHLNYFVNLGKTNNFIYMVWYAYGSNVFVVQEYIR